MIEETNPPPPILREPHSYEFSIFFADFVIINNDKKENMKENIKKLEKQKNDQEKEYEQFNKKIQELSRKEMNYKQERPRLEKKAIEPLKDQKKMVSLLNTLEEIKKQLIEEAKSEEKKYRLKLISSGLSLDPEKLVKMQNKLYSRILTPMNQKLIEKLDDELISYVYKNKQDENDNEKKEAIKIKKNLEN